MKNDMKKRILSAQLALILLLMLWCGTYFETKESQRQMEQLEASQSESGASNAVEVKRKLMYKACLLYTSQHRCNQRNIP